MPESFKPYPYTFKLIDCFDRPMEVDSKYKDKIIAQCPPFDILLDHTIAVLWTLFSPEKQCDLRSSQIGWALKFLEGMNNGIKLYSEDVHKAIQCLECALVNCISSEAPPSTGESGEVTEASEEPPTEPEEEAPAEDETEEQNEAPTEEQTEGEAEDKPPEESMEAPAEEPATEIPADTSLAGAPEMRRKSSLVLRDMLNEPKSQ